jgi:3-hydroxyacyl-[acyl-carrier-protein] dehydratase
METISLSREILNGEFFFDPDDKIYRDHFPSNPVVPGALIIHAFLEAARKMFHKDKNLSLKNFRFTKFITPGEYSFAVKAESGHLNCILYDNNKAIVSGEIMI